MHARHVIPSANKTSLKKSSPSTVKIFDLLNNRTSSEAKPYITEKGLFNVTKYLDENDACQNVNGHFACKFPHFTSRIKQTDFTRLDAQFVSFQTLECGYDYENCVGFVKQSWIKHSCNFAGSHLALSNFSYSFLQCVEFKQVDLSDVDFSYAKLKYSNFENANLTRTNFTRAELLDVPDYLLSRHNFVECNIDDVKFNSAQMKRVFFEDSVKGERVQFVGATLDGCGFYGSTLSHVNFSGARISHSYFLKPNMTAGNFPNTVLSSVNLRYSILSDANFQNSTHTETMFFDVNLQNANFRNSTFITVNRNPYYIKAGQDTNLSNADLCNTTLAISDNGHHISKHTSDPNEVQRVFKESGANIQGARFCRPKEKPFINTTSLSIMITGSLFVAGLLFLLLIGLAYFIKRHEINTYAGRYWQRRKLEKTAKNLRKQNQYRLNLLLELQNTVVERLSFHLPAEIIEIILQYTFDRQGLIETLSKPYYQGLKKYGTFNPGNEAILIDVAKEELQYQRRYPSPSIPYLARLRNWLSPSATSEDDEEQVLITNRMTV